MNNDFPVLQPHLPKQATLTSTALTKYQVILGVAITIIIILCVAIAIIYVKVRMAIPERHYNDVVMKHNPSNIYVMDQALLNNSECADEEKSENVTT